MRLFCQLKTSFTPLEQWNIMASVIPGLALQFFTLWNASRGTDIKGDLKLMINPFVFAEGLWIIMGITAVAPTELFVYSRVLLAGINQWVALIHQLQKSTLLSYFCHKSTYSLILVLYAKIISVWFCCTLIHVHCSKQINQRIECITLLPPYGFISHFISS